MTIAQIDTNLQKLISGFNPLTFIYDFLLAFDIPKSTIKRLQVGGLNLSKVSGEIAWKKKLFFKEVQVEDLHELIDNIIKNEQALKHNPRFVIVTDYKTLLAIDTKTNDSLDIPILEIAKHLDFFLPLAGMEKAQYQSENPADVKAAERMAKLYDEIRKDNPLTTNNTDEQKAEIHNLNVFLSRLLFCFFAEDTDIFEKSQFTLAIGSHTQEDGSDLHEYLDRLFEVMNTPDEQRKDLPHYLNAFPFVNGGLFRNRHHAPRFTRKSRNTVIESGELDWSAINPDIFGSMIQAVITPEHRGGLGMHYTSVPNIMKVIEPLFLNDLYEEYDAATSTSSVTERNKKLNKLLQRIWKIKIFDPACGSGNFLIIAYKELRKLEMKIFKALGNLAYSEISLGNFYGIELDDFAHEVAILSLWLAEHQMNQVFFKEFNRSKPALPLKETGNIVQGNACRLDWEMVCPKNEGDEIYILGNPPYLGSSMQSKEQKEDLAYLCLGFDNYKNLDYIACWFIKASNYINGFNSKYAFVSTNSICQGEQVALLWNYMFNLNLEISYAYPSFKWTNNAKAKAAVIVSIIGVCNKSNKLKVIYNNGTLQYVENINPYLTSGKSIVLQRRANPISILPIMLYGNKPTDGGNLILSINEKEEIVRQYPKSEKYFKKFISGSDYLNGDIRWCLWIKDNEIKEAEHIEPINIRLEKVKKFRLKSDAQSTIDYALYPNRFRQITFRESPSIVIPLTSSERRVYIPFGFLTGDTVVSNSASVIYDAELWNFGILSSSMHMAWVRITAGRLKSDYRYSSAICYNNFPLPYITEAQKQTLERCVHRIIEEREKHSEKTLAQLYDPDKMPDGLREAHHQLDLAVERCYRAKPFESDEERLEYLFKLYEQMIEAEKNRGSLFGVVEQPKKKKK